MKLKELIKNLEVLYFFGDPDLEITNISYDSRTVKKGGIFVALKGNNLDGHDFIYDAVKNGAKAILVEKIPKAPISASVVQVKDTRRALSKIALNFFNPPLDKMNIIGITGTNGKTTTTYLIESILSASGKKTAVIGTINYRFCGKVFSAPVTTPESADLMQMLRKMGDCGVTDVIMEVSSHSLVQGRVADCPFKVAVFTNITRDHLDYHGCFEEYFKAKAKLFLEYKPSYSVINADDPMGKKLIKSIKNCIKYGLKKDYDIWAKDINIHPNGIEADIITPKGTIKVYSSLIGDFNLYNILAAVGVCYCLGIEPHIIKQGIENVGLIPGRMEVIKNKDSPFIIVDYAHSPDALLRVLRSIGSIFKKRPITVFGCGGDRDKGKRKEMGKIAAEHSNFVIITSDNPRSEDPFAIMSQIEEGIKQAEKKTGYMLEADRRKAIKEAINMAKKDDVILVAGKGHENYQIIGNKKIPFDDRKVIRELLDDQCL